MSTLNAMPLITVTDERGITPDTGHQPDAATDHPVMIGTAPSSCHLEEGHADDAGHGGDIRFDACNFFHTVTGPVARYADTASIGLDFDKPGLRQQIEQPHQPVVEFGRDVLGSRPDHQELPGSG